MGRGRALILLLVGCAAEPGTTMDAGVPDGAADSTADRALPALAPAAFSLDGAPVESHDVTLARRGDSVDIAIRAQAGELAFHFEVDSLGVPGGLSVGFHSATLPNTAVFTAADGAVYSSELGETERFGMAFIAFEDAPGGSVDARFKGALRSAEGQVVEIDLGRVSGHFPEG